MVTASASAKALSENTTVLQAGQFPIRTVKLYQNSATAEISRTFPLTLEDVNEPQVVHIVHLPAGIQSVDVSVTSTSGNVTILDHYYTSVTEAEAQEFSPSSKTLHELESERLKLEDERRLRQQSFGFLATYMGSLAQCKSQSQAEAAQMITFFDEFVELGVTRSSAIAELDAKLADVGRRITEETEHLSRLSSDLPVKVVAVLACSDRGPAEGAELTVTYVVRQVSWKPAYDLHVAMTGNTPSPSVTLDFRCTVTQWTGENWDNISLALTTADQVSQLIQLPEPKRIDISLGPTAAYSPPSTTRPTSFGQAAQAAQFRALNDGMERERDHDREYVLSDRRSALRKAQPTHSYVAAPPSPQPLAPAVDEAPEVNAPQQAVSQLISPESKHPITHIANGCIFIPSDRAAHHVLVASLSLQAEFMRVVVPSIDTRVYYTCEVKNTSEYVLLPGTVKAYLNDKHVSSMEIHNTETPQILECSLAVDTGVKVMHSKAPDALPSVAAFTGKATTTYTSASFLHNTHAESIRGVVVRSSVPLPTDPRITIVLKQPAGLAEIDEGSVSVKEGCLARWSTTGGRKGKQAGLFEWVCDVNPGTEVLKAVWEVCAPQDLNLLEQVRS